MRDITAAFGTPAVGDRLGEPDRHRMGHPDHRTRGRFDLCNLHRGAHGRGRDVNRNSGGRDGETDRRKQFPDRTPT